MAENNMMIPVEVAYARPDEQVIISLEVPLGTTLAQAILLSGLARRFPEIGLYTIKAGIFSQIRAPSTVLCAGDRVEIYRPLSSDAKARRRQRAAAQRLPGAADRKPGFVTQD
ncbi:MAG TPA: RnfH family protein [Candidatus Competibacteraceae bacterium]|nr:RnfH family protein [Candidatus Competibacteraceae bacterium]